MKNARMIGNYVNKLISEKELTLSDLRGVLGCSDLQVQSFLKGRKLISYSQLSALADFLSVPVSALLAGDKESYAATVVHCMNEFQDEQNREKILDLIDDYMDVLDSVSQ